jgi:beta-glucosidase
MSSDNLPAEPSGVIELTCDVRNAGLHRGKCVVQVYVAYPPTIIGRPRPVKELKAFKKVDLMPNSSKTMSLTLDKYSVSLYDAKNSCWLGVKGKFTVLVGVSSVDIAAESSFDVRECFAWKGV